MFSLLCYGEIKMCIKAMAYISLSVQHYGFVIVYCFFLFVYCIGYVLLFMPNISASTWCVLQMTHFAIANSFYIGYSYKFILK